MFRNDPEIDRRAALSARVFQLLYSVMFRMRNSSPALQFATKEIARPRRVTVSTRHGKLRALVYAPVPEDVAAWVASGGRPPVHMIVHGGAFIARMPRQEDNVARYLASEVGCYIVIPDYDTAPKVRFPVSEEQTYDVFRWIRANGEAYGWDGERVSVGGASAGGKLALNVAQQAIDVDAHPPVAVSAEYGAADISRPDSMRTSPKPHPVVPAQLMQLIRRTYFKGADLTSPLASPALSDRLAEFPPTLIMTAAYDTLRHEMNDLAADMTAKGVQVTHRQFDGVDHGFTHTKPADVALEAITLIGDLLRKAYT
jgi:acetyl esterase